MNNDEMDKILEGYNISTQFLLKYFMQVLLLDGLEITQDDEELKKGIAMKYPEYSQDEVKAFACGFLESNSMNLFLIEPFLDLFTSIDQKTEDAINNVKNYVKVTHDEHCSDEVTCYACAYKERFKEFTQENADRIAKKDIN